MAQQDSGGTAAPASPNPPILAEQIARATSSRKASLGDDVIYVAGPEDEGHGGIIPGEQLAALVVMEGSFPNLKVFASTSDTTLLKKGVPFGSLPGQWHY